MAFGQSTLNDELQQSQHAQTNRQQADQPRHSLIVLQVHGGQRQGSTFQARKASFHQVFVPVSQNRFRQEQVLFRMVRAVHAPAEASHGSLNRGFISTHLDRDFSLDAHFAGMVTLLAHISFLDLFAVTQVQQTFYPALANDLFGGLAQCLDLAEVSFALLALIQSFQGSFGLAQAFL
jgi:hypothetical protein